MLYIWSFIGQSTKFLLTTIFVINMGNELMTAYSVEQFDCNFGYVTRNNFRRKNKTISDFNHHHHRHHKKIKIFLLLHLLYK